MFGMEYFSGGGGALGDGCRHFPLKNSKIAVKHWLLPSKCVQILLWGGFVNFWVKGRVLGPKDGPNLLRFVIWTQVEILILFLVSWTRSTL